MAKLYRLYFRTTEKDFTPDRRFAKKKVKGPQPDLKLYVNLVDGSATVLEDDIKKYWEYGDGIERLEFAGELDDSYLKPILSEPYFVDEQIKSKKNGETVGYQG